MNFDPSLSAAAAAAAGTVALAAGAAVWWRRRGGSAQPGAARPAAPTPAPAADAAAGPAELAGFERLVQERCAVVEKAGRDACLLVIGIDDLRLLRDDGGAAGAERALAAAAAVLRAEIGATTPLARIGADAFGAWLDAPREAGEKLAQRLVQAFEAPLNVDGRALAVPLSVGLAVAPEHGAGARLIGRASAAMQSVRRSGGHAHAVFDARIGANHNEELQIARELQHAVVKRQLELFFQPRIDATTRRVSAVEALLRWRHPTLGLVSPARFIPVAERHGLIETIGGWVLDAALRQSAAWRQAGVKLRVAVNVSGVQFRQDDFATRLERGMKAHGVPAEGLLCELTQAVAMENTEATRKAFARLAALGVEVSIDDFAAGAAGLAALSHQPVRELQIDRATVAALARSHDARTMVESAVQAARELGLRVVAEGIETEAQRDAAVRLGCQQLQGHLIARPMSARAVLLWAADAPSTLAQTLPGTGFQDTQPMSSPDTVQGFEPTRISLGR
ncbi:putative bifunctional diguanylate cyclase/phosphodiesterase [Piscinibacter sp.]|uniref:putative bifunctional diguanylate cyclase/phosphodiesterase n=1 Tax=Piscinibacter sp. TaxID=1903157 RepID=UPI0039E3A4D2